METTSKALMNAYELGAGSKLRTRVSEVTLSEYSRNTLGFAEVVQLVG
jgi:hypothetical protein